jgi:hypothetical protein
MKSETVSLEMPLDGKVHVFLFIGTEKANIKFARIDDLDTTHPDDQLNAALNEIRYAEFVPRSDRLG